MHLQRPLSPGVYLTSGEFLDLTFERNVDFHTNINRNDDCDSRKVGRKTLRTGGCGFDLRVVWQGQYHRRPGQCQDNQSCCCWRCSEWLLGGNSPAFEAARMLSMNSMTSAPLWIRHFQVDLEQGLLTTPLVGTNK